MKGRLALLRPRDLAMEDWMIAQALDILHGRTGDVIARIRQLAEDHPTCPGSERAKIIRKILHFLAAKQPWMAYPAALAGCSLRCWLVRAVAGS